MSSEISCGACVAVAGMHRSGTSLIASMLGDGGVDLGRNFIAANLHNQRGYFEDRRFVNLHDAMLAANGSDWALTDSPRTLTVPGDLSDRARELIRERVTEARRSSSVDPDMGTPAAWVWGWKDPRTTLFLEFWLELLPSLTIVVPFRDAAGVVASLRRRRDLPLQHHFRGAWPLRKLGLPMTRDDAAIRLWETYNNRALACAARFPGRMAFIDGARAGEHMPRLMRWLRESRGVLLPEHAATPRTDPSLMNSRPPLDLMLRTRARVSVASTTRRLQAASAEVA